MQTAIQYVRTLRAHVEFNSGHTVLADVCEKDEAGRPLLTSNPLFGVKFPRDRSPRRPALKDEHYRQILGVAADVSPILPAALVIAHDNGRRVGAWRRLRWRDIDFAHGKFGGIRWPEDTDKARTRSLRPITPALREALLTMRRSQRSISEWVFPHPGDRAKPCTREVLDDQLREAYRLAELQLQEGGVWHPFRRKWVSDRKRSPIKDLAVAGGWKSVQTHPHPSTPERKSPSRANAARASTY